MVLGVKHQPTPPKYRPCGGYELMLKTIAGGCKITKPANTGSVHSCCHLQAVRPKVISTKGFHFRQQLGGAVLCTEKSGRQNPWPVFGTFPPGCADQGLRVQRLLILAHVVKAQVPQHSSEAGGRFLSQWL